MINKFGFYKTPPPEHPAVPQLPPPLTQQPEAVTPPSLGDPQIVSSKPLEKRTYLSAQEYHPFQIPPNLQLAELHRRATRFGVVSTASILQSQSQAACNCCAQHEKQPIATCARSKTIYRASEAQGFYFTYIKVIIVALAAVFALSGLYTLVTTLSYCGGESGNCVKVYGMALPQNLSFFNASHLSLSIVSAFLFYPFVLFLFYRRTSIHEHLKQSVIKISHYSLLLSGVDPTKLSDRDLIEGLQGNAVETVLFTHKIGKYLKAMNSRYVLEAKKNLYFKRGLNEKYEQVVKEINEIGCIVLPFKNCINIGNERELRTDKIIIKFRTVEDRETFYRKYHVNLCIRSYNFFLGKSALTIKGVPLYVESLGEPEEMLWQNLQVPLGFKLIMMLVNTCVSVIILGGSFAIILMLTRAQNNDESDNDAVTSLGMAVLIEVVNVVLYLAIFQLTEMESRITLTGKTMARMVRSVFFFFFNTTLIPFFLFILDWIGQDRYLIYEYIISLFFVTNVISPLSPILNPLHLYKLYCRRRIIQEGKDCLFTQLQTNEAFEQNDFQLEMKYQLLCQRIMNCCFYAAVFPEVLLFTIFGLALDYWIEKWWLLNHCCIPKFNSRLASVINRVSVFFPPLYLLGYLANLLMMREQHSLFAVDSDPIIIGAFFIASLIMSFLISAFARRIMKRLVRGREELLDGSSSVSIRELDYSDLNPTSFLHYDIRNTVDLTLENRQRVVAGEDNFQMIERFVLKQQTDALVRRDSDCLRVSRMRNIE